MTKQKPMTCKEAGKKGGLKNAEKGPEYFREVANIRWNKKKVAAEA